MLCVGLDPQLDLTPPSEIAEFNRRVIEETADFVAAYKPQSAFYEAGGDLGWKALKETIDSIRDLAPHALVILDVKRADVPNTAKACAKMAFKHFDADAATVNPYMGPDGVEPFLEQPDKGAFLLCRTSNPQSDALQGLRVQDESDERGWRYLYEVVALQIDALGAAHGGNAGAVVGATYPGELERVRKLCPTLPLLVPGIGAQGGDLEKSVCAAVDDDGFGLLINSSRSVIYSGDPGAEAEKLQREINVVRAKVRKEKARAFVAAS